MNDSTMAKPIKHKTSCLVCRSTRLFPLYCFHHVPLSIIGLPKTEEEAKAAAHYKMDMHQCANCGHVFNTAFNIEDVAYVKSSNLMYNLGRTWNEYQNELVTEWIEKYEIYQRCVVEIGSGQGLFLRRFLQGKNRCIGFEPGQDAKAYQNSDIEIVQDYFSGETLATLDADILICRHVIEHMSEPLDFLQEIAIASQIYNKNILFFAEVPLINKALSQIRTSDFLYEHVSHFSFESFGKLFELAGFEILEHKARYENEVVTIVAKPKKNNTLASYQKNHLNFKLGIEEQKREVWRTLQTWQENNIKYAVWAGTGKGAAFLNMFELDERWVNLVVDSDLRKANHYVPGTAQKIISPEELKSHSVEHILILSNWHARDIEHEIFEIHKLQVKLFVHFQGRIVPLTSDLEL